MVRGWGPLRDGRSVIVCYTTRSCAASSFKTRAAISSPSSIIRCIRRWARCGQGHAAQSLRESDDVAVRPSCARDDDVSRNRTALRVDPAHGACHGGRFVMANVQAALGISTPLYQPVPLAAKHQTSSVALLSAVLHVLMALRRTGAAARACRLANLARDAAAEAKVTAWIIYP
ncbi:hypothetical protein EDB86DRAFT_1907313 [Lactarius hatsudake]|nr:hypothetical protein EDB86DRAFT_1907313 [Lactarius hatsudake]